MEGLMSQRYTSRCRARVGFLFTSAFVAYFITIFASLFASIVASNFLVSAPSPAEWGSRRSCCLKETCQDSDISMEHGFPIPLFTSILIVLILEMLEASEASGVSDLAFASTLSASASVILSYFTKIPPSSITSSLPDVMFSSCLKDTLGTYRSQQCIIFLALFFHQPFFCLHLTIFFPLFLQ